MTQAHPRALHQAFGTAMIILFISLAIASLAWLTWDKYQTRQHYLKLIQVTKPYQFAVSRCFAATHALFMCQPGQYGIPQNITDNNLHHRIEQLSVINGKITMVPRVRHGIKSTDTYELTPYLSHQRIAWHASGGGVENGYAN